MTINRTRSMTAVAAMAALAVALVYSQSASSKELTFGSWPPAGEYLNRIALPKAFEEITKETNGEITWKLVPGGQLAGPKETPTAVQDGLMDGGLLISTYVPNVVPATNTIYSTIVFSDDVVAASAAALETLTLHCPDCIEEFKKLNAVPLAGWTSSPYYLTCREPVKSLADLKGKRVRATGGNSDFMTELGAVPIAATLPEAVGLLQRGGLDCFFGVVGWLKVFGYADFAKNLTDTPLGLTGPAVLMWNRDTWNDLTADQKQAHLKAASYISAALALGQFVIENDQILDELKETKGLKVVEGDDEEFLAVAQKFDKIQRENNIAAAKKFGVSNPEAIIDAYTKAREKWGELSKEIGRDIDKFAAAIQREIYDKVDPDKL